MKIILDDTIEHDLYPFTTTRSVVDIRIGIFTLREKWEAMFPGKIILLSESGDIDLSNIEIKKIPANILPSKNLLSLLKNKNENYETGAVTLTQPWQIFKNNDEAIREDFKLITENKTSQSLSSTNKFINGDDIFIEEGAVIDHSILNASAGPIYIGKNATVMEGCLIRGPFAMCEGSTLKMGTKIYGATTIGPECVIGGEIKNSILFGYSNKAHDGYLGDSVIGEWCNIGAGSSNSNLKNTAATIKVWSHAQQQYISAAAKCGLLMGDYSRCAINTSFNTGTVSGVSCNIFCSGFPPKYIPDFTWGNERYHLDKALQDIDNWKKLKGKSITDKEIKMLSHIYHQKKITNA